MNYRALIAATCLKMDINKKDSPSMCKESTFTSV